MTNLTDKGFSEIAYKLEKDKMLSAEPSIKKAVEALQEQNLPTDKATIEKIVKSETAFEAYINSLRDEFLNGKYLPKEEKQRIYNSFAKLYNDLQGYVTGLSNALKVTPVKYTKEGIEVDNSRVEEIAKEKATFEIDLKRESEYYTLVMGAVEAIQKMQAFEAKNVLPDFFNGFAFNGFSTTNFAEFALNPTEETFKSYFDTHFRK